MTDLYAQLAHDLLRDEGIRLKPYRCPAGKLTIGVGRNLDDVGITEAEARYLLDSDIERVDGELRRNLPWLRKLSEDRQRALLNMAFNLGVRGLLAFKRMIDAVRLEDWETAAKEALDSDWARQVGARAERIAALLRGS